jgi:hypothetical protein
MIDYLTFIEELKKIRSATFKRPVIDETIEKYEKRVSESESENAPKEEVDILKMSPNRGSSFMSNYQNANMRDYDDTQEYEENSEGDIVRV